MSTVMVPANAAEALGMLESAVGFLAGLDAADMPAEALAECLQGMERADAVGAAARGQMLAAFDAAGGHLGDGQRTTRTWLVHATRVTRGQAAEHNAVQALAAGHGPLLAGLCVQYDRIRGHADGTVSPDPQDGTDAQGAEQAAGTGSAAGVLALLEQQILAAVIAVVSGPGGVASFLRTNLLGKGLNGPSLPLDVGQSDQIPAHLRRLVALRDQGCQYPGGCDQPAAGCEPHHVIHRADGGRTSLANLKDYCWWHHHVVLHELGWELTVRPDGTSQVREPGREDDPQPQPATPPRVTSRRVTRPEEPGVKPAAGVSCGP
jgi:hypothetical protein